MCRLSGWPASWREISQSRAAASVVERVGGRRAATGCLAGLVLPRCSLQSSGPPIPSKQRVRSRAAPPLRLPLLGVSSSGNCHLSSSMCTAGAAPGRSVLGDVSLQVDRTVPGLQGRWRCDAVRFPAHCSLASTAKSTLAVLDCA